MGSFTPRPPSSFRTMWTLWDTDAFSSAGANRTPYSSFLGGGGTVTYSLYLLSYLASIFSLISADTVLSILRARHKVRCNRYIAVFKCCVISTLILLTWKMWWAPNNASKWQMGFNSAFKGLMIIFICYNIFKYLNVVRRNICSLSLCYDPEHKTWSGRHIFFNLPLLLDLSPYLHVLERTLMSDCYV